jgi:hypothetical protein
LWFKESPLTLGGFDGQAVMIEAIEEDFKQRLPNGVMGGQRWPERFWRHAASS